MSIKCKHWKKCKVIGGGCCTINEYDRPSFGVCLLVCKKNTAPASAKEIEKIKQPRSKGLGDTVKKVINKITRGKVKQCGGCKKRQDALNKLVPYGDNKNAN